ncbi:potassium/proton antiporter [Pseudonocardia sp. K10HN5]|uniref:Potassium/proton antiporter n=1 Tax=Pseudonocardia acidicola TaxID=2724939 RepID=A0ABX1SJN1_9PSEU|nr:potassium/proton antiporter [Pseudonocardia acidicola]NMI01058.1 potassium/proton antiporter [Pseudonocardia acidicola]
MGTIAPFGLTLLIAAGVVVLALLSNRISARLRIPAPAIFLVGAAAASDLIPSLRTISIETIEQIVTVALVVILFDGGMDIGARKLRLALGPVLAIGVLGTFLTAGATAVLAHVLFGFPWLIALLLGTALAPTDPAVVFSVLGNREVQGRAGVIIEGESGANDPVGIALLVSLLTVRPENGFGSAVLGVLGEFMLQMAVGAAVGVAGGWLLLQLMRRFALPSEGLYPLRTLAISIALYGAATALHGSGFLAVFLAGILIGDAAAPFKGEIERFHASLASLAEIIAFVLLGLTVSLSDLITTNAWLIGLVLAALLTFVVRPLVLGPLLMAARLKPGERIFVLWCGLKGAVPILLGTYILATGSARDVLVYEIIFAVVLFSVVVQGALVPTVADRCGVRMRRVEPRPWALGVRLRNEPDGARRYRIVPGAPADGRSVRDLHLGHDIWISLVVRDGHPVQVRGDTRLRAGDEVLVLVDPEATRDPAPLFTRSGS